MREKARRQDRGEEGSVTIEFVLLFPVFIALILGGAEIGYFTVSGAMLDRGLDRAIRDIRLGRMTVVTLDTLKPVVCGYADFLSDCEANIHIALESADAYHFTPPATYATCIDRSAEDLPNTVFSPGAPNELMLVRACLNVDPLFPTTPFGAALAGDAGNGYSLVATSGFVYEP
ncbi:hypothetical protein P73_3317 [Celeribacter indicus]|uniref:TadE-like domain-containing protein n=1 Tax=Celeribacter indicus TaxID=1208324 RepID=A0A0B5E6S3_9RHOB|nr:hypothetical protein P73_3317 [Celeribacter indicus]